MTTGVPGGHAREGGLRLGDGDGARAVLLELLLRLPHADDRDEPVLDGGEHLGVHDLVGLAVALAPLGVPDEHVGAVERLQERARDVPRVRARVVGREVLRAEGDRVPLAVDERLHAPQVGERREHRDLDLLRVEPGVLQRPGELLHEGDALEVVQVHLPVPRDEGPAGCDGHEFLSQPSDLEARRDPCPPGTRGSRRRPWRCGRTGRRGTRGSAPRRRSRRRRRRTARRPG